jgi:Putative addiction module component
MTPPESQDDAELETIDPELEALWLEEVGRRIERVKCGESRLVPTEEVQRLARAMVSSLNKTSAK